MPLNVVGISEGKENFAHHLIRLMYGTCDHPDESLQSIINDTCIVTHAVTLVKLVSQVVHFHANNFINTCGTRKLVTGCVMKIAVPIYQVRSSYASVLEWSLPF